MRRSPIGYFAAAMLAGAFVALGGFVSMTVGGMCTAADVEPAKLIAAFAFTAALSLVISAGCELFTGNNMVIGIALFSRRVSTRDAAVLWLWCWIGNLVGSWLMVALYMLSGACGTDTCAYINAVSAAKVSLPVVDTLIRAALCNMCVCLAVWCSIKLKSESAKLIMVFWCILIFMVCGFEHSVANMSIVGIALTNGAVSFGEYARNILLATVGNMAGGIGLVALPYWLGRR